MAELQLTDDFTIHYEEWGQPDAPAVVLLHPFMCDLRTWLPVIPPLAEEYRVLAMDLRGHGATSAPAVLEEYALGCYVEDLRALLDANGVEVCALAGCGLGGSVALQFAATEPDRVAGLALTDTGAAHVHPAYPAEYARFEAKLEERIDVAARYGTATLGKRLAADIEDEFLRAGLARRFAALDTNGVVGAAHARRSRPDLFPVLRDRLRMPVLLGTGEASPMRGPVELTAQELETCRTVLFGDVQDFVLLERPEAFGRALLTFLRDIESGNDIRGQQRL